MAKTTILKVVKLNTFQVKSKTSQMARNAVKRKFGKKIIIISVKKSPTWAGDNTNRNMYWVDFKRRVKK